MESSYTITLTANASMPVKTGITLVRGDSGQKLNIKVNGIDISSTTAKIAFARPNGAVSVESAITAVDGVYVYTIVGNELSVPGLVVAQLKFYEGTKRVSTASFMFDVIADVMDGGQTPTGTVDKSQMEEWATQAQASVGLAAAEVTKATTQADRAKTEADRSKSEADRAQAIVGIGIATTSTAGIVKPDGTTTFVDADGVLSAVGGGGGGGVWGSITGDISNQTDLNTALSGKANTSDVYTKTETYTKTEVDALIEESGGGQQLTDLKVLGWTVPSECPLQNVDNGNGTMTEKVGRVCLGDLDWQVWSFGSGYFYADIDNAKLVASANVGNAYAIGYTTVSLSAMISKTVSSKSIALCDTSSRVYMYCTDFADISAVKSAMANTYLYYELATYKTLPIDGNEITTLGSVGDEWTSKTYSISDYVIYQNALYKAIATVPSGTLPTNSTYWEKTSVASELVSISGIKAPKHYILNSSEDIVINGSVGIDDVFSYAEYTNSKYIILGMIGRNVGATIDMTSSHYNIGIGRAYLSFYGWDKFYVTAPSSLQTLLENNVKVYKDSGSTIGYVYLPIQYFRYDIKFSKIGTWGCQNLDGLATISRVGVRDSIATGLVEVPVTYKFM